MAISKIEQTQLDILDVLIEEGGYWTAGDGQVLVALAQAVYPDTDVRVGSPEYHRVSLAVLRLEEHGMVTVDRRFRDQAEKANIIEGIRLL